MIFSFWSWLSAISNETGFLWYSYYVTIALTFSPKHLPNLVSHSFKYVILWFCSCVCMHLKHDSWDIYCSVRLSDWACQYCRDLCLHWQSHWPLKETPSLFSLSAVPPSLLISHSPTFSLAHCGSSFCGSRVLLTCVCVLGWSRAINESYSLHSAV